MRAALLTEARKPIEIVDDVEVIEPRAGEVRVNVKYCGLCNSDLGFVTGKAALIEQGIQMSRIGGTTVIVGSPTIEEDLEHGRGIRTVIEI